ncbi:hypothetical protein W03_19290 [Nitrosomonas sp. PY1]|uniref:YjfB family protein n=1 Tax=Nitrosomonas sp. PY1 TaxID=1803906 RepID=UPI001FC8A554|nr:YjfB family protein [Nitrosomonas sp. PY1]GKS69925.1 hypothetical protein W03_19290 [Nitrosomonas sp. PY1]
MDIADIANTATAMNSVKTDQAVSIAVLKKAMDINAAGALTLIEAIPESSPIQSLPPHLGQNINTTA